MAFVYDKLFSMDLFLRGDSETFYQKMKDIYGEPSQYYAGKTKVATWIGEVSTIMLRWKDYPDNNIFVMLADSNKASELLKYNSSAKNNGW